MQEEFKASKTKERRLYTATNTLLRQESLRSSMSDVELQGGPGHGEVVSVETQLYYRNPILLYPSLAVLARNPSCSP
ncbi:Hypothetical protein FKW44_016751 [Caligus rogercresseyi]|uniref:Uncharacterized protein n=1 Tax=Caligus rogercresseyi TaxID=217165 RepID=A0A7T8H294_CALRO|nr:Hypothetical protein FKW44_016751 [Caligus rogercresseyi]